MHSHQFTVGEIVESSNNFGGGVDIEIVELLENQDLKIKIIKVDNYWSQRRLSQGEEYILEYHRENNRERWSFRDNSLPWFSLSIDSKGNKKFVYYR